MRMYLDQLDRLDQKILTLLIENARYSYSEIGEKVGLPHRRRSWNRFCAKSTACPALCA